MPLSVSVWDCAACSQPCMHRHAVVKLLDGQRAARVARTPTHTHAPEVKLGVAGEMLYPLMLHAHLYTHLTQLFRAVARRHTPTHKHTWVGPATGTHTHASTHT